MWAALRQLLVVLLTASIASTARSTNADAEPDLFALSLDELVQIRVTAQRREEDAQDVPLSVSSLHGDSLETLNASGMDVRQLSARTPSLLIESSFGRTFPRFFLRGMGNTDFDLVASQPVSLMLDEVVQEHPLLKGAALFDLERVEVLRGPQGTLFGRNTPAGTVKLESRRPTDTAQGYGKFGLGRFGSQQLEAALNLPLTTDWSSRFALLNQQRDDWIDNAAPGFAQTDQLGGYDDRAGRVQLRYRPDERLDLLLNYHFHDADADARVFHANLITPGGNDMVADFSRDTIYQDAAANNQQRFDTHGFSVRTEYNTGHHSIFYIGASETAEMFSRGDIDGGYGACTELTSMPADSRCDRQRYIEQNPYQLLPEMGPGFIPFASETAVAMPSHAQYTHELRLASNELGALDYQLGVFRFDEDFTIENLSFDTLESSELNGLSRQRLQSKAWAIFGSLDYDWNASLSSVIGARYSDERRYWRGDVVLSPSPAPPLQTDADVDDSQLSWDVSLRYRLQHEVSLYFRVAKGFRAPSIQGRNLLFSAPPTTADSETLLSYETGFKSELWQRRLRLNGALFRYVAKDQQLTAVGGGSNIARLLNAERTVGYGAELESEWTPLPALLIGTNLSYNHTELQDADLAVSPCASGCQLRDPIDAAGNALIDGNSLPQAPRWIGNLNMRYSWPLGEGQLFIYTDWSYRSAIHFFLYEAAEYRDDGLLEGGLRLGYDWRDKTGHYQLALLGRNITDQIGVEGAVDFNNRAGYLNEPRYWGVEFKARFQ